MGTSENIISAVLIIIIFIGGGIAYAGTTAKKKVTSQESFDALLTERKIGHGFDTALSLTEPRSGRQYGDLLASAVYYRTDSINVSQTEINITAEFTERLQEITGNNQLFIEVFPDIRQMDVVFIGSGEERMLPIYAALERDLRNLQKDLSESHRGINVSGGLVLIEGQEICSEIDIVCSALPETVIYNNNLSSEHELIKYQHGFFRPTGDVSIANDWETLTSYYLVFLAKNKLSFEVVFPIADSLPGSSTTNQCNRDYAASIVGRDNTIIQGGGFLVHPILVNNGDAAFCPSEVVNHSNTLVERTIGKTLRYNQNFLTDISRTIQNDITDLTLHGGSPIDGSQIVIERHLQLPSKGTVTIRLHVARV
jgi:hypothetical protein